MLPNVAQPMLIVNARKLVAKLAAASRKPRTAQSVAELVKLVIARRLAALLSVVLKLHARPLVHAKRVKNANVAQFAARPSAALKSLESVFDSYIALYLKIRIYLTF